MLNGPNGDAYWIFSETLPLKKQTSVSVDDAYYVLDATNTADIRITKRDGTVYHFGGYPSTGYVGKFASAENPSTTDLTFLNRYSAMFSSIVDSNGNTITYANSVITDTIGRTVNVNQTSIGYTAMNGHSTKPVTAAVTEQAGTSSVPWPVTYQPTTLPGYSGACHANPVPNQYEGYEPPILIYNGPEGGTFPAPNIYTITLQNGSIYTLTFDVTGNVTKVTYPSGGYTKYDYLYGIDPSLIQNQTQNFGDVSCIAPTDQLLAKHECSLASGSCTPAPAVTAPGTCAVGWPVGGEATTCYSGIKGSLQPGGVNTEGNGSTGAVVIDPYGNESIHGYGGNFSYSLGSPFATSLSFHVGYYQAGDTYYSGQSAIVKTVMRNNSDTSSGCLTGQNPYNLQPCNVTTTYNDVLPALTSVVNYQYDPNGYPNITQIQSMDFTGKTVQTTKAIWEHGGIYQAAAAGSTSLGNVLDHLSSVTSIDATSGNSKNVALTYDARGNIQQSTVSGTGVSALSTTYTPLDTYGRPTQVQDPDGNITKYFYTDSWYDSTCPTTSGSQAYLTAVTNALNQTTHYSYDSCTGALGSSLDANGNTTTFTYDDMARTSSIQYPDGGNIANTYVDSAPNSIETMKTAAPDPTQTTNTVFDGFSRVSQTQLLTDPSGTDYVDTTYDALGRVASSSNPYRGTNDATYGLTTYGYDELGRTTSVTHSADNSSSTTVYSGSQTTSFDETGRTWVRKTDALGRLVQVLEPDGSSTIAKAPTLETDYTYDGFNNLLRVDQWGGPSGTAGERIRTAQYDSLSRLVATVNPETGKISYSYLTSGATCAGDWSLPCSKTDARGAVVAYIYDALNRLSSKTRNGGSSDLYFYDGQIGSGANMQFLGANLIGRLSFSRSFNPDLAGSTCSLTGAKQCDDQYMGYDKMGRLNQLKEASPSEWGTTIHTTSYVYDAAGNATTINYPDGSVVTNSYDGGGRLSSVIAGTAISPGSPFISNLTYLPSGSPKTLAYGNGVNENVSQNARLQTCEINAFLPTAVNGTMIFDRQLLYSSAASTACAPSAGDNGNILQILDNTNSAQGSGLRNQTFAYDNLNRLKSWNTASMSGMPRSQAFQYDAFGNMQQTTGVNMSNSTPSYDALNHIVSSSFNCGPSADSTGVNSSNPEYDLSGNVLCSGAQNINAQAYIYDAESRLTKLESQSMNNTYALSALYTYDAGGNRIRKDTPPFGSQAFTEYAMWGGQPLAEKDQTGHWVDYIYANGKKIAKVDTHRVLLDLHGVRASGNTICGGQGAVNGLPSGIAGMVIASGDMLMVDAQQNISTDGGIALVFTNGTGSGPLDDASTGMGLFFNHFTDGKWHHMAGSLSAYVGLTVSYVLAGFHQDAALGTFDLYIANAAILHANGSITPILTGQAGLSIAGFAGTQCGASQMSSGSPVVATTDAAINTTFYLDDHLGTTQMELSGGGWPVWEGTFSPLGAELADGSTLMRYKFTGKERDQESGLDYFGARYYASSMGRWISPDWAAQAEPVPYAKLDNPQSLNLYNYMGNNPLGGVDADGHWPQWLSNIGQSISSGWHSFQKTMQEGTSIMWNGAVNNVNAAGRGDPAAIGSMVLGAAVPVPEAEGGSIVGNALPEIETESATTTSLIQANAAQGAAWEQQVGSSLLQSDPSTVGQLRLQTQSGVTTVMDFASKDSAGSTVLTEAKSSATARLTPNQAAAHPEIAQTGATVVGSGKPGYPTGTQIPPTKVNVVRPPQ